MTSQVALKIKPVKTTKPEPTFTLSQYLKREEQAIEKHEFYNGKIILMPGGKSTHNEIALSIGSEIRFALKAKPKKYHVYNSDQKIYIETENTVLYPDAVVICEAPEFWNGRNDLIVNPLVIIEVLSASTSKYDRKGKFMKYQMLPTFKEYNLVEQNKPEVESWYKIEKDTWQKTVCTDINASIELRSLNVSIALNEIYDNVIFPENN